MSNPSAPASRTSRVLTTALVASGTKAGVRTSPCASFSVPARAYEPGSRVWMVNTGAAPYRRPRPRGPRSLGALAWRLAPPRAALRDGSGGRRLGVDRLRRVADADRDLARLALLG